MIVAERKPLAEIVAALGKCRKVLVVSCSGCTAVCFTGGAKQAEVLASSIRMHYRVAGVPVNTGTVAVTRQCDREFLQPIEHRLTGVDAVVSLACGVGVQFLAEAFADLWVVPALNTRFAGGRVGTTLWEERCRMCGDCILHLTGGICPVTRCSKSLLNGPCGGAAGEHCEIDSSIPCAWIHIYERLKRAGRLELWQKLQQPKDWSRGNAGGLGRLAREDYSE
ncbi:MAG: methylenetetrahydrofolate reductase C-terminal domain-containing protein [Peptococcaceae bacterium]|nr:methylenetetrahydrofolate reductase C-terminal domain-containing protein [Peptococcaceae bacterium]